MKITKKITVILLILLCYSFCYAQQEHYTPSQALVLHEKSIATTAYIMEGTVTQQKDYYANNGVLLTCSIIQITSIYKGSPQLKLGTIKVISFGGSTSEGGGEIGKGGHYIIFCKPAYPYMLVDSTTKTDNTITLTIVDYDEPIVFLGKAYFDAHTHRYVKLEQHDSLTKLHHNLIFFDRPDAQWGDVKYEKIDSLYSFFKKNGLTVEEETDSMKH